MSEAANLAAKLKSEGEKMSSFFAGLTPEQWSAEVYTEGSAWTIRSILAHLMTAERAFVRLFEDVRQGGPGASEDFSIDRYNARQQEKTHDLSSDELLNGYRDARAKMIVWVSALHDSDLERTGRHPFLGVTTLREMIKMIYIHNQTHFRDIRRTLNQTGPAASGGGEEAGRQQEKRKREGRDREIRSPWRVLTCRLRHSNLNGILPSTNSAPNTC